MMRHELVIHRGVLKIITHL